MSHSSISYISVNTCSDIDESNSVTEGSENSISYIDHKPNVLNILALNCCGFNKKVKYPEFDKLIRNHDIVCMVETKTDDRDEIKLPGYVFKLKNRKKTARVKSGGILLGFKEE